MKPVRQVIFPLTVVPVHSMSRGDSLHQKMAEPDMILPPRRLSQVGEDFLSTDE
jgi:hypothetical protein